MPNHEARRNGIDVVTNDTHDVGRDICRAPTRRGVPIAVIDTDAVAAVALGMHLPASGAHVVVALRREVAADRQIVTAGTESVDRLGSIDVVVDVGARSTATSRCMTACQPHLNQRRLLPARRPGVVDGAVLEVVRREGQQRKQAAHLAPSGARMRCRSTISLPDTWLRDPTQRRSRPHGA